MIPLVVVSLFLASGRPLYAAPVTQTSSSDPFPCDAVVLGTNDILELVPATTGLPIPVSTLTNIDIENCGSTAICIEEVFTESASHVVSSALAEFKVLPASIVTAIEDIVNAVEAGVESGRASSNTIDGGLMVSSAAKSTGQIGSNITGSGNLATPVPKSLITYVLEVTNSQSSVTDEVLEVGYHSGVPSTNLLFAYADSVTTTVTSMPSGVSIQTITTSTCTTAGAVVTATSSGTTVTTEVPQLCVLGVAFRIYGLPGFHSSLDLPSLCHRAFSFPLGIIWRLLCPPGLPPRFSIISDDPEKLPPGGGPPGNGPPDQNPNDSNPDGQEPSPTEEPSPTTQNKAPSSAVATSNQQTRSTVPSSAAATSSRTTRSTMSSSAAATPTRYIVYPLMNASQPAIDSLFAPYAQRADVTQAKGSDGLLRYFAVELSDSERSAIDAHSEFLTLQDSLFDIEMPDTGQEDPDLNGASYASEPLDPTPNVGARGLPDKGPRTKGSGLFKRIPLQNWRVKITTWSLAIISLVPGLPFPNYERSDENIYPYYFVNPIDSAPPVRVYAIDTGLNMQHPEFNGRLRPGITEGQTQDDWDIDWLFPRVDTDEFFKVPDGGGGSMDQKYEYSYIDPDSPNFNGGIHPAYTDFRLIENPNEWGDLTPHGTRVSAFIMGDTLGQAQNCRYTMVKLPQYTNGPRSRSGVLFPLFSAISAIKLIVQDIRVRKDQGENLFVISSSMGYLFGGNGRYNSLSEEEDFENFWSDFLSWVNENGITIVASAGNARWQNPNIELIPARLFRNPQIVVGSVTPDAMAHRYSQGNIGDGILTAYAPSAGALVVSSDPDGDYTYSWFDPAGSAVTSYACGMTVGFVAQTLALAYSGNAPIPPYQFEQPNAYAYRMVKTRSAPRVAGGPPILYNNAPRELFQDCGGSGAYRKRDGSCPLTQIDLPTGTAALPESVSAAIMAGNGGQFGGNADGMSPTLTAAIGDILGGISAGLAAGHESSTLTTSPSTITALCSHAADPQNTCAAIANSPGWCVCGDSPNSYPVQASTDPACGWTTLPPTTSFDCPAATITSASDLAPATTNPTPSTTTTTTTPPNAGIAIWLQQYSSTSGAEVATWFAYTYEPGDAKLGDACNSNSCGMTPVPDGTPVSDELRIYPEKNMTISAYHLDLRYEPSIISEIGGLWVIETKELSNFLASCSAVVDAEGEACGSQYEMTPRLTCEWVN